jgi:hypothetical protein
LHLITISMKLKILKCSIILSIILVVATASTPEEELHGVR